MRRPPGRRPPHRGFTSRRFRIRCTLARPMAEEAEDERREAFRIHDISFFVGDNVLIMPERKNEVRPRRRVRETRALGGDRESAQGTRPAPPSPAPSQPLPSTTIPASPPPGTLHRGDPCAGRPAARGPALRGLLVVSALRCVDRPRSAPRRRPAPGTPPPHRSEPQSRNWAREPRQRTARPAGRACACGDPCATPQRRPSRTSLARAPRPPGPRTTSARVR